MKISYAITACNEAEELGKLLDKLITKIDPLDEIVIVFDEGNTTGDVEREVEYFRTIPNLFTYYHKLNNNFAQHKNFMTSKCTRNWIFNIDADEIPSDDLLTNLRDILELNDSSVDVIALPRINIVNGLTDEHIIKWGWRLDNRNRVNWPDYQMRLYKNISHIKWEGKVHEKLVGWKNITSIPQEMDELALIHIKDIDRQEKQNEFYLNI